MKVQGDRDLRLLSLGPLLSYGDRFAIPPLLVTIADDLDEPLAAVTMVATVYFLLYGVTQPVHGVLSDRFGRVKVIRIALVGMGLGNLVAALAPDLGVLMVAKAATAAFAAAILPTSLVYLGDTVAFDRRQGAIANILTAGAVGTVTAIVAAGVLSELATWRLVFAIPSVLAILLAVRLSQVPESVSGTPGARPWTQARLVLRHRWAVLLILIAVLEGAVMLGFLTFLAPALEASGQSAAVAGLVVATYGVAVIASMQVVKRTHGRSGRSAPRLILVGGAGLLVAYLVAASAQSVLTILVASVLIGFAFALLHSTLQTWATEVVPEARGTAVSFFVTGVFTGASIATAAVSGLAGDRQYGVLFLVAAGLTVPLVAVAAIARSRFATARGD